MAVVVIPNASFEDGNLTGWKWTFPNGGSAVVSASNSENTPFGTWAARVGTGAPGDMFFEMQTPAPVQPNTSITAKLNYSQGPAAAGLNTGQSMLRWYNADGVLVRQDLGTKITATGSNGSNQGRGFVETTVTGTTPEGAVSVAVGVYILKNRNDWVNFDNFSWNLEALEAPVLLFPAGGQTYQEGDDIPFRIQMPANAPTTGVTVKYYAVNTSTSTQTEVGTSTTSPYSINGTLPAGTYNVRAEVTYPNGVTTPSNVNAVTVGAVVPVTREYKASNAYTYLVAENFASLGSGLPPTAVVTGVEVVLDYELLALARVKDKEITDVSTSRYQAAFDMFANGNVGYALLDKNGTSYERVGNEQTTSVEINRSDFTLEQDEISEGKRYVVLSSPPASVVLGAENQLFGFSSIPATDFSDYSIGIRFFPTLGAKPDYADAGDACFRFAINRVRLRVYFDAGSVEYYFASPDKTQVIKAELVAYNVSDGLFQSGDASGVLQLAPDLEIVAGTSTMIGADWTIHSNYPPTDANEIGDVQERSLQDGGGMTYNSLPGYEAVIDNRSRYQFITANFYGDLDLESMYGVNGVGRAFAYNGELFYNIWTQPDPVKDKPRHVAFHHTHLALGYNEGRVDISVVGSPWNFSGDLGASSWATGDSVVGLLPLQGTILGVFGNKSIVGISGTTVDNFAQQTLSPNIGAVEYTVTDMGFPVYANAYGIYTLSQTANYGDYLGTPMSQPVSPWLRPRLVRKMTSDKEVVVGWPVRSKNQYRLAFADGYVMSMTINNGSQANPTFSKQKYFITAPDSDPVLNVSLYEYNAIVPAAISSQLDDSGEERIHIAHQWNEYVPPPVLSYKSVDTDVIAVGEVDYDSVNSKPYPMYVVESLSSSVDVLSAELKSPVVTQEGINSSVSVLGVTLANPLKTTENMEAVSSSVTPLAVTLVNPLKTTSNTEAISSSVNVTGVDLRTMLISNTVETHAISSNVSVIGVTLGP